MEKTTIHYKTKSLKTAKQIKQIDYSELVLEFILYLSWL